jgi:rod shape-determining protein MreD
MSLLLGTPLMLLAAILQAAIIPRIRVYFGQPDLIVVIVLAWALLDRGQEGLFWGFVGGFILDLFSGVPMGMSSFALLPATFMISLIDVSFYRGNEIVPVVIGGIGALTYHIFYTGGLLIFAHLSFSWPLTFFYVTLPSVLFDTVLILPAIRLLRRLHERLHPVQVRL